MYRILAILCLVAPAFGFIVGPLVPGLKYKLGEHGVAGAGPNSLIDLPLSNKSASVRGYQKMNRPRLPWGYCGLQLWCRSYEFYRVCPFFDETGDVAGAQINIPCSDFNPLYDMKEQGYTIWTTSLNDEIVRFYSYFIFFASPDPQKRIESKEVTVVLRDDKVYYSGFGGHLASVTTDTSQLDSSYTKQDCIGSLGYGYYQNMTKDLECSATTLSPLSLSVYQEKLTTIKVTAFGHFKNKSKYNVMFEDITPVLAHHMVPTGPECLYSEISNHGAISMTIILTSTPWRMTCAEGTRNHGIQYDAKNITET